MQGAYGFMYMQNARSSHPRSRDCASLKRGRRKFSAASMAPASTKANNHVMGVELGQLATRTKTLCYGVIRENGRAHFYSVAPLGDRNDTIYNETSCPVLVRRVHDDAWQDAALPILLNLSEDFVFQRMSYGCRTNPPASSHVALR